MTIKHSSEVTSADRRLAAKTRKKELAVLSVPAYRSRHPEMHRKHERRYRLRYPERHLWRLARDRAKAKNHRFTISETDVVIPPVCPVLDIPIVIGLGLTDGTPTLDRIHPSLGYVPGNVRVISMRANLLKSNMTVNECRAILRDLEERI